MFYSDAGHGPAVLLLHGWTCEGSDWAWLARDLERDHRVIVPDQRGHGRSGFGDGDFTPSAFAGDAAALLRHLGIGGAAVIGHSLGSIIGSALAAEDPGLVSRLVLVDPVYGWDDDALAPILEGLQAAPVETALAVFGLFYGPHTPEWLPWWHARRLSGLDPSVVAGVFTQFYTGDQGYGRKVNGDAFLPGREAPALSLHAPFSAHTVEWERVYTDPGRDVIEVWDGAGHFLHQEFPDRFAARVREWIGTR